MDSVSFQKSLDEVVRLIVRDNLPIAPSRSGSGYVVPAGSKELESRPEISRFTNVDYGEFVLVGSKPFH